jgi:hypothetical protein
VIKYGFSKKNLTPQYEDAFLSFFGGYKIKSIIGIDSQL